MKSAPTLQTVKEYALRYLSNGTVHGIRTELISAGILARHIGCSRTLARRALVALYSEGKLHRSRDYSRSSRTLYYHLERYLC